MTVSFNDFGVEDSILKALESMGFKEPSPIQQQAIPLIQQGRDVIALAETGSGKTATCAIPVCARVDVSSKLIQALIVVPTRELALQYATEAQKIGKVKGVKAFAVYGGEDITLQLAKLRHGVQVLVATPGRLIDLVYRREVELQHVETLILDEADEMLSMGFYDDLEFIIQCLTHDHQTLLFSATMPKDIRRIAGQHMKDPQEVKLTQKRASPKTIEHCFVSCHPSEKDSKLKAVLEEFRPKQSIIFCQSRIQCEKVCKELKKSLSDVDYLHGGMSQDLRTTITSKFRSGRVKHLVATDVAARGLDFSGVTHVVMYQLHPEVDIYLHRSGRTGRQDREGTAISLVTNRDLGLLKRILERIEREPRWLGSNPLQGGKPTGEGRSRRRTRQR